jgi:hypothetical protein
MRGGHLITEEGQTPHSLDGVDFETLFPTLDENDPGLVQGLVTAPFGAFPDRLGVNPVQIATEVYGPAGGTSGRRVAGDERSIERRQLEACYQRESIAAPRARILTHGGATSKGVVGARGSQVRASGSAMLTAWSARATWARRRDSVGSK